MNRRSLALAVASVFAVPLAALAEGGNVQIYSTINVDFEGVQTSGATAAGALPPGQLGATPTGVNSPSRSRVTSNSSNIGFRGSNDIGAGLSAIFQVESAIGVDNQATFGSNTASGSAVGGGFATRNTGVGLAGQFGRVLYGQWDTPYKAISGAVDPLYFTGIAYTGAIVGTPGFGIGPVTNGNVTLSADGKSYANAVNASFERRQGNSVQYWSPTFDGLKARIVYSANEGRSNDSSAVTQVNPAIWGFSAEYENGPAYVAWGHERHDDYFGLGAIAPAAQAVPVAALGGQPSASSRDTGNKFVGRYTAGDTQLGAIYERLKYDQTNSLAAATDFKSYARNAYAFTLVQRMGPGMLRALYGRAQDGRCALAGGGDCSADGLGVRQITLGYSYKLSEQTDLYGFYTRIVNDAHATYQFANAAGIGATAGADNIGAGLGVRYTFDKTY
jgi:predicted porin